jgi:MEMO1 family protein
MITFAAVVPHSPLLIESIGKENQKHLSKTLESMNTLKENLYLSKPDVILVISSHANRHATAFSVNLHDEYFTDFKDFGDMATKTEFGPDLDLIAQIQRAGRNSEIPVTLDSSANLDYGTSVPLELLVSEEMTHKIVPVSYSGLSPKEHLAFGALLKEVLHANDKRVAVIASGDLSHCLTTDAPGGFHKDAQKFDDEIQRAVRDMSASTLLAIDDELRDAAKSCVYEQLLILFGILEKKKLRPELLSYESPFGVGYLVAEFHL